MVVPFTMHVPFKAVPGDYVGAFVASLRTVGKNKSGQQVILYQRVGTRVYVQVSGPLVSRLVISDLHTAYQQVLNPFGRGSAVITYNIRNAGNVNLNVDQMIAVSQVVGPPGPPVPRPSHSCSPEPQSPSGSWSAVLARIPAQRHGDGAGSTPTASGLAPISASAQTTFWAVPWPLIVLIVAIVLLAYLTRRYRRRRGGRADAVAAGDDLADGGEAAAAVGEGAEGHEGESEEEGPDQAADDTDPAGEATTAGEDPADQSTADEEASADECSGNEGP